ncbi:MAG: hypothetical protein O3C49_05320 [Proteobacteria bacterium]|nr:hypothetical protein [Pseudomonadota bacterium]MDA1324983.1 hypothetical protein [Pseudomonadota bacterium]
MATTLKGATWRPPEEVTREQCLAESEAVLAMPDIPLKEHEDLFRIQAVGLEWDIGAQIYEPEDPAKICIGADGKKVGVYLLSGGDGDFKTMAPVARLLAGKFGMKVATMTYPGRLYLDDPSRHWPGDTINPDGTIRTPIWLTGEHITPDQYEVITDTSIRERYGTRTVLHAIPGTVFWDRLAGWPAAFEEGGKQTMARNFPEDEYSIFVHGHSTGGPFVFMLSQRVPNIAGVMAVENSAFGFINEAKLAKIGSLGEIGDFEKVVTETKRTDPFYELYIRTWRDKARYVGPEKLGQDGPIALMRLPMVIEEVMERWEAAKMQPQFKCEYTVSTNIEPSLEAGARATAERMGLNEADTAALVRQFLGYGRELKGPDAKPVPPVLFCVSKDSRDHGVASYKSLVMPLYAEMNPAPKTSLVHFQAGVHSYWLPEEGLPAGIAPAVAKLWFDAVTGGYSMAD